MISWKRWNEPSSGATPQTRSSQSKSRELDSVYGESAPRPYDFMGKNLVPYVRRFHDFFMMHCGCRFT